MVATDGQGRLGGRVVRVLLRTRSEPHLRLLGVWGEPVRGGSRPRRYYPVPDIDEVNAAGDFDLFHQDAWDLTVNRIVNLQNNFSWSLLEVDDDSDLRAVWEEIVAGRYADALGGISFDAYGRTTMPSGTGDDEAVALCVAVGMTPTPLDARLGLSRKMSFFADDDRLVVIVPWGRRGPDVDEALAYGLAYAGDRDLWLVLPHHSVTATMDRLPWIDAPVRVWSHGAEAVVKELLPLRRVDVLGRYRVDALETAEHLLGDPAAWVAPLTAWAQAAPSVRPAHRPGYLAWKCGGMTVLRLTRTGNGVRVQAGIQYRHPTPEQPAPFEAVVTGPIPAVVAHRAVQAASRACAERLDGSIVGYREHRLQSLLTAEHLGLQHRRFDPEFPALRPPRVPAFVDFCGVGAHNRIHVVETKIGSDVMVALQGLDYWIWATANLDLLAGHFEVPALSGASIDFVLASPAAGGPVAGPYTPAQLEAFSGQIPWRIWTVPPNWESGTFALECLRSRTAPDVPRA
jgi:hypothetical protein